MTIWTPSSAIVTAWTAVAKTRLKWTPKPPALPEPPDRSFTLSRFTTSVKSDNKDTNYQGTWNVQYFISLGSHVNKISADGWDWTSSDGQVGESLANGTIYNPSILAPGTAPEVTARAFNTNGETKVYGESKTVTTAALAGLAPATFAQEVSIGASRGPGVVHISIDPFYKQPASRWDIYKNGAYLDTVTNSSLPYAHYTATPSGNTFYITAYRQNAYGSTSRSSQTITIP